MVACSGPMRGRRADRLNQHTAPSGSVPGILGSFGASGTEPRRSLSSALGSSEVAQTFSRASTIGQMYSAGSIANRKWGAWVRASCRGRLRLCGPVQGSPPPLGQELAYAACPRLRSRATGRFLALSSAVAKRRGAACCGAGWRGRGESPAMAARASRTRGAVRRRRLWREATTPLPEAHPRRRRRIVADDADQGARRLARDSGR